MSSFFVSGSLWLMTSVNLNLALFNLVSLSYKNSSWTLENKKKYFPQEQHSTIIHPNQCDSHLQPAKKSSHQMMTKIVQLEILTL